MTILVDYENVTNHNGLKGLEYVNDKDTLIIFYSAACKSIRKGDVTLIEQSGCKWRAYKLQAPGKNALDFYISVQAGILAEQGERHIAIISNDKGFKAVVDFVNIKYKSDGMIIVKAPTIEAAISAMNDPDDGKRKDLVDSKMALLNIEEEFAKYQEKERLCKKIKYAFGDTDYENLVDEIISFVSIHDKVQKKKMYSDSMHVFGRDSGREIYNIIKEVV